jgi:hypothetical protein
MADVIGFPSAARVRELEAEIERLTLANRKLTEENAVTRGVYALVRLQMADILATCRGWRKAIDEVEQNIEILRQRLPGD